MGAPTVIDPNLLHFSARWRVTALESPTMNGDYIGCSPPDEFCSDRLVTTYSYWDGIWDCHEKDIGKQPPPEFWMPLPPVPVKGYAS